MTPNCINSIGLIFDIIGVIIIFIFGLPSSVNRKGVLLKEVSGFNDDKKYKRVLYWAYGGLSLLIIGFVLQLISNYY